MKININDIRIMPESIGQGFNFSVFGQPSAEIVEWAQTWGFRLESGMGMQGNNPLPFTNILIPKSYDLRPCFHEREPFVYVDGFSPNLNKHLHIGHLSNLIIAKALQCHGVGQNWVALLGDTVEEKHDVSLEDGLQSYHIHCANFGYRVDQEHMASSMQLPDEMLEEGEEEYAGTKILTINGRKKVGVKSGEFGNVTSYFYQDVAFAKMLGKPTLYITGNEQADHFAFLKEAYPHIEHFPLGHVTLGGKKQSSRDGNAIMLTDVISMLMEKFKDIHVAYNSIAGLILRSVPSSAKSIDMNTVDNVKLSPGFYFSYSAARLKSAGVPFESINVFNSNKLQFAYMKSKFNLNPKILVDGLLDLCKDINNLYETHRIKDDENIKVMFSALLEDLEFGMKLLGMFSIKRVERA